MTDDRLPHDKLPIVFNAKPRNGILGLFFAAVCFFAAYAKWSEQYPRSLSFYHLVSIDGRTAGWLFLATGALLAFYSLVTLVRRCPRLTLDEGGIVFARCFGNPVQIPWSRFEDVVVRRARVPGPRRSVAVDLAYVVTTDGKQTCVGGRADEVEAAIRRVAARMKSGGRAGRVSAG